jgi:hypothetical protein
VLKFRRKRFGSLAQVSALRKQDSCLPSPAAKSEAPRRASGDGTTGDSDREPLPVAVRPRRV